MGTRKAERVFPPEYVSLETLAYRLDCPVATIERYVREGVLPRPRRIGALVRWRFAEIEAAIEAGVAGAAASASRTVVAPNGVVGSEADPFLLGVSRVETG